MDQPDGHTLPKDWTVLKMYILFVRDSRYHQKQTRTNLLGEPASRTQEWTNFHISDVLYFPVGQDSAAEEAYMESGVSEPEKAHERSQ